MLLAPTTRAHFLPSTHFPLPCLAFTPLFQSSRCPLSFSPPHPAFFLTAGKNFVHTSSEPGTKLHFLFTTTCPSASSDQDGGRHNQTAGTPAWVSALRLLTFLQGAGWGEEVFLPLWKRAGKPPGFRLFFSFLFFFYALASLTFRNILFNQRKLLLNTVHYIPPSAPIPCIPCQGFGLFLMTGTNVEVLFWQEVLCFLPWYRNCSAMCCDTRSEFH